MIRRVALAACVLGPVLAGCGGDQTVATSSSGDGGDGTLVATDRGPVQGSRVGETRVFLGIPFAAPPVGPLRWKPPQPAAAWSAPRSATARGPACAQLNAIAPTFDATSSEDCLTLNVWAPEHLASPAPVMVWIHGGTYIVGSGGLRDYDGQKLSEATGAIVVTINYRLGPLGFLASADLVAEDPAHPSSGMYGFEDQRAALAWTQANIAAFGGDAHDVTLFGESAGGFSTCYHLVSPKSAGLFQRAIIESGACDVANVPTESAAEAHGVLLAQTLGCTGAGALACLRAKSAKDVLLALPVTAAELTGGWSPVVDGWNLPDAPAALLESGAVAKVPTLLGANADEGTLFFALDSPVTDEASYAAYAESLAPGQSAAIVAHYPSATYGSPKAAAAAALGDVLFVCPARRTARALSKAGVPTFLYHFTYAPPGAILPDLGSFHSSELPFVFGDPGPLLPKSPTAAEAPLAKAMMGYWGRMAAGGDPNGDGAFAWPPYTSAADENVVLDLTVSKQSGLEKSDCDFVDAL